MDETLGAEKGERTEKYRRVPFRTLEPNPGDAGRKAVSKSASRQARPLSERRNALDYRRSMASRPECYR
jgi:hypothetical protein